MCFTFFVSLFANMSSRWCVLFIFVAFGVSSVLCRTIFIEENPPTSEELNFMKRYGYLLEGPSDEKTYTSQSISESVKKMQQFAGLPQTGVLDPETRSLFKKRRCGVKDIESKAAKSRRRRYVIQQGWGRRGISYRVINGSSTLTKSRVEELIAAGLAVWAPHGGLRFLQIDDHKADIEVTFTSRDHGDGFPFDGPGRVVAHAFPPPHGSMHFDDDELWGDNPDEDNEDVTDFFAVAVHEIGHALGLSHSNVKSSVMYPYYQVPVERLHIDDILGMQELYLKDDMPQAPESVESTESSVVSHSSLVPRFTKADREEEELDEDEIPDLCFTNYDTIQVIQNKIFVFEEEWMWVLSKRKKIDEGYPRRFHEAFRGLPPFIKAIKTIYEKQNGHIVIFHGRSFWEFSSRFRLIKRGRLSEYRIPPKVSELTTAFISNYNNKTYLIEYERFWRFDETTWAMDGGYPKEMSAWRQVPYPVDAAIIWQGDTFFFRGPRFWRFDNKLIQAHEYYPLPTAQVWFPCEETDDMLRYATNEEI